VLACRSSGPESPRYHLVGVAASKAFRDDAKGGRRGGRARLAVAMAGLQRRFIVVFTSVSSISESFLPSRRPSEPTGEPRAASHIF